MITRFRIEGRGASKEELIDELAEKASRIITAIATGSRDLWECTDDVTSFDMKSNQYRGRMVLVYCGPESGRVG